MRILRTNSLKRKSILNNIRAVNRLGTARRCCGQTAAMTPDNLSRSTIASTQPPILEASCGCKGQSKCETITSKYSATHQKLHRSFTDLDFRPEPGLSPWPRHHFWHHALKVTAKGEASCQPGGNKDVKSSDRTLLGGASYPATC